MTEHYSDVTVDEKHLAHQRALGELVGVAVGARPENDRNSNSRLSSEAPEVHGERSSPQQQSEGRRPSKAAEEPLASKALRLGGVARPVGLEPTTAGLGLFDHMREGPVGGARAWIVRLQSGQCPIILSKTC